MKHHATQPSFLPVTRTTAQQALDRIAAGAFGAMKEETTQLVRTQPALAHLALVYLHSIINDEASDGMFKEGMYFTHLILRLQAEANDTRLPEVDLSLVSPHLEEMRDKAGPFEDAGQLAERLYRDEVVPYEPALAWAIDEITRYRVQKDVILLGVVSVYKLLKAEHHRRAAQKHHFYL